MLKACTDAHEMGLLVLKSTSLKTEIMIVINVIVIHHRFKHIVVTAINFVAMHLLRITVFHKIMCRGQTGHFWIAYMFPRILVYTLGLTAPDSEYGYGYKTEHYDAICSNILCDKIARRMQQTMEKFSIVVFMKMVNV